MPIKVDREAVRLLLGDGAQIVDALPAADYARSHLPGALSIPLADLDASVQQLRPDRPVVVYCYDLACDLSPRAARRLETLGYRDVYLYEGGKVDWIMAGLPVEGRESGVTRAVDLADRLVPTCAPGDRVEMVLRTMRNAGWDTCFVTTDDRTVLGRLYAGELAQGDPARPAAAAMHGGPSTFRPGVPIVEMRDYMRAHDLRTAPITTSEGRLLGLLRLEDAERAVGSGEAAEGARTSVGSGALAQRS